MVRPDHTRAGACFNARRVSPAGSVSGPWLYVVALAADSTGVRRSRTLAGHQAVRFPAPCLHEDSLRGNDGNIACSSFPRRRESTMFADHRYSDAGHVNRYPCRHSRIACPREGGEREFMGPFAGLATRVRQTNTDAPAPGGWRAFKPIEPCGMLPGACLSPASHLCAIVAASRSAGPGGVAERSKALVLKTSEPRGSVGSNPTPPPLPPP